MTLPPFLKPGEYASFGTIPESCNAYPIERITETDCFVTLNPLKPGSRRSVEAVLCFRNFLVEFDGMSLEKQEVFWAECLFTPTYLTWSGGKSYHAVFCLKLENSTTLTKELWYGLSHAFKSYFAGSDKAVLDPCRLTRTPGAIRPGNGNVQVLVGIGEEYTLKELLAFLEPHLPNEKPKTQSSPIPKGKVPWYVQEYLSTWRPSEVDGENYRKALWAVCRLIEAEIPETEIESLILLAYQPAKEHYIKDMIVYANKRIGVKRQ